MDTETLTQIYRDLREELSQIENAIKRIEEKGQDIAFVQKNVRAMKAILHAFKSGFLDDDTENITK